MHVDEFISCYSVDAVKTYRQYTQERLKKEREEFLVLSIYNRKNFLFFVSDPGQNTFEQVLLTH